MCSKLQLLSAGLAWFSQILSCCPDIQAGAAGIPFCLYHAKAFYIVHVQDLETDSQLVFKESPGSQLVKSLNKKLTAALAKHDSAQSTCQELEQTAQSLRDHRLTHNAEVG